MSDKPEPWTLPADAATYWHDMYSDAADRIEALEAALRDALNYIERSCDLHASSIVSNIRAALDKDAGQ